MKLRSAARTLFGTEARALQQSIKHFDKADFLEWQWNHGRKLRTFDGLHEGEDCFIIGNGPSLREMDLAPLADHHTFGLNKIFLMLDEVDLNLSYLVSVNPLVIEQSASAFEAMDCPRFIAFKPGEKLLAADPKLYFLYTGGPFCFSEDLQGPIHQGYTVTFVAMQIAFYMGFRRVFLIGVDHSFPQADGEPNERQTMDGDDLNHFHPDYFRGEEWQLPDLEASELAYRMAHFAYSRDHRIILDATVGGQLDVFPKVDYSEAVDSCSRKR